MKKIDNLLLANFGTSWHSFLHYWSEIEGSAPRKQQYMDAINAWLFLLLKSCKNESVLALI